MSDRRSMRHCAARPGAWSLLVCAAAIAAWPGVARAQHPIRFALGASLAGVRVHADLGSAVEALSGTALALDAGAGRGALLLEARYSEGHLTSADSTVDPRDLVEGSFFLGARLGPFVTILAGPHARAYAAPSGTRRWLFWEARAQARAPLVASRLEAYAELGATAFGSTSLAISFDAERSGEVGARYYVPRAPLALRLAYRIARSTGRLPDRSDTV
jgi:uncharacterized protein YfiM (DUF2279 family)